MAGKRKNIGMALVAAVWLGLAVFAWLRPPDAVSVQERRELAQFPEISEENRQKRLKGWNKAVKCALGWGEE